MPKPRGKTPVFAYMRSSDRRREIRIFQSGVTTVRYMLSPFAWSAWRRITMTLDVARTKRSYEEIGWIEVRR